VHEGKYRQVRRMLDEVRHPVLRLIRIRYGPVELGEIPPGRYRYLTPQEIAKLKALVASTSNPVRLEGLS